MYSSSSSSSQHTHLAPDLEGKYSLDPSPYWEPPQTTPGCMIWDQQGTPPTRKSQYYKSLATDHSLLVGPCLMKTFPKDTSSSRLTSGFQATSFGINKNNKYIKKSVDTVVLPPHTSNSLAHSPIAQ